VTPILAAVALAVVTLASVVLASVVLASVVLASVALASVVLASVPRAAISVLSAEMALVATQLSVNVARLCKSRDSFKLVCVSADFNCSLRLLAR